MIQRSAKIAVGSIASATVALTVIAGPTSAHAGQTGMLCGLPTTAKAKPAACYLPPEWRMDKIKWKSYGARRAAGGFQYYLDFTGEQGRQQIRLSNPIRVKLVKSGRVRTAFGSIRERSRPQGSDWSSWSPKMSTVDLANGNCSGGYQSQCNVRPVK